MNTTCMKLHSKLMTQLEYSRIIFKNYNSIFLLFLSYKYLKFILKITIKNNDIIRIYSNFV